MKTPEPGATLSVKEIRLMRLRQEGWADREIAYDMCASIRTIETYGRNIRVKLGAFTQFHCMVLFLRKYGWSDE